MDPAEFCSLHAPVLEREGVRHNVMLGSFQAIRDGRLTDVRLWSLGASGECAIQSPRRPVLLAKLNEAQCRALADDLCGLDCSGVAGPDDTAYQFAARAAELGAVLLEPMPQCILALTEPPPSPGVPGAARVTTPADARLLAEWVVAFCREVAPFDPVPTGERLASMIGVGERMLWAVDGEPVAMANVVRRTQSFGAIGGVYTSPAHRGRGYAAAVTTTVAIQIFSEGRTTACLHADLRNPYANRCYARIGFRRVGTFAHVPRQWRQGQ